MQDAIDGHLNIIYAILKFSSQDRLVYTVGKD